ncbi:hypothetical protein ACWC5I_44135 [Kitasatospora sp. NPDC001574]
MMAVLSVPCGIDFQTAGADRCGVVMAEDAEDAGGGGLSNWGDGEGGEESFFLGGGSMLDGVDYEAAWLEARAAAGELNTVLAGLGLHGDDQVRAQAGWSDDGRGVVYLRGTLSGARKLRRALYRMTERQVSGRAVCDSPEGRSVDD